MSTDVFLVGNEVVFDGLLGALDRLSNLGVEEPIAQEDAATAEISRSQVWQQLQNEVVLEDTGQPITPERVREVLAEEVERLRGEVDPEPFAALYEPAARLVGELCLSGEYVDFLTLPAYERYFAG